MALALALIFDFLIAGLLGAKREIGFVWSFVACLFLSPLIGIIITLASDKLPPQEESEGGTQQEVSEVPANLEVSESSREVAGDVEIIAQENGLQADGPEGDQCPGPENNS